jgi:hypothetical protein
MHIDGWRCYFDATNTFSMQIGCKNDFKRYLKRIFTAHGINMTHT